MLTVMLVRYMDYKKRNKDDSESDDSDSECDVEIRYKYTKTQQWSEDVASTDSKHETWDGEDSDLDSIDHN